MNWGTVIVGVVGAAAGYFVGTSRKTETKTKSLPSGSCFAPQQQDLVANWIAEQGLVAVYIRSKADVGMVHYVNDVLIFGDECAVYKWDEASKNYVLDTQLTESMRQAASGKAQVA